MFSVLEQERTSLRDSRGTAVFRRLYLCDTAEDVATLPVTDAPGSGAVIAEGGGFRLLNHRREWKRADNALGLGGCLWRS